MPAAVSGAALGHPNIRATHRKTLELTREAEISARATCVVGVAAQLDEGALAQLHGRVELTLSLGPRVERVRGRLNPAFRPGDPLVVRRAPAVTRDALIVDADRAAADLPRSLVAELADDGARLGVRVAAVADEDAPGVLVVGAGSKGEEVSVAGIAEDLAAGRRASVAAGLGAEARAAVRAAHDAGHTVLPAPGLGLPDALRAVGGLAPDAEVITDVPAESLARRLRGAGRATIVLDPGTPREQFLHWRAGERLDVPGARGRRAAYAVEARAEPSTQRAEAMAAAGASTRDVARALQDDAGLPRRRAYELALDLTAATSSVSRPDPRTSR